MAASMARDWTRKHQRYTSCGGRGGGGGGGGGGDKSQSRDAVITPLIYTSLKYQFLLPIPAELSSIPSLFPRPVVNSPFFHLLSPSFFLPFLLRLLLRLRLPLPLKSPRISPNLIRASSIRDVAHRSRWIKNNSNSDSLLLLLLLLLLSDASTL